ncbi:hypothetical protein AB0H49_34000 [Nocardia sp. NPDC050713]
MKTGVRVGVALVALYALVTSPEVVLAAAMMIGLAAAAGVWAKNRRWVR